MRETLQCLGAESHSSFVILYQGVDPRLAARPMDVNRRASCILHLTDTAANYNPMNGNHNADIEQNKPGQSCASAAPGGRGKQFAEQM